MLKHDITEMHVTSDNGIGMYTGQFPGGKTSLSLNSKRQFIWSLPTNQSSDNSFSGTRMPYHWYPCLGFLVTFVMFQSQVVVSLPTYSLRHECPAGIRSSWSFTNQHKSRSLSPITFLNAKLVQFSPSEANFSFFVARSFDDAELPGADPRVHHVQVHPAHSNACAHTAHGNGVLDRVVRSLGRETPHPAHRRWGVTHWTFELSTKSVDKFP